MKRFFQGRHDRESSPIWLVIFSDLSTNLMLFFLILFAMTRMTMSEREAIIDGMEQAVVKDTAKQERMKKKRAEKHAIRTLKDTIVHGKLKKYAKMEVDEDKVKLTLELPVFFMTGSARITDEAMDSLYSLIVPLKQFENDIVIEGHTDNVPILGGGRYPSNWELSVARAVSVINFFNENEIPFGRMVAGGYGEYHPLQPNDTPEHRAMNRRIEITIVRHPRT
jgi:chemotaxis protein MotB